MCWLGLAGVRTGVGLENIACPQARPGGGGGYSTCIPHNNRHGAEKSMMVCSVNESGLHPFGTGAEVSSRWQGYTVPF